MGGIIAVFKIIKTFVSRGVKNETHHKPSCANERNNAVTNGELLSPVSEGS
jgi:hypothetical protein